MVGGPTTYWDITQPRYGDEVMKGLVLCGGIGARLRPLTHTGPKQLIPVANKPIVFYCIEHLVEAGIEDIGIVVGYTPRRINLIKQTIGDGSRWGVKISYIRQKAPIGIGDAVNCARDFIKDDKFVVYLGDNLLGEGIAQFVEKFKKSGSDASILVAKSEDAYKYGVVQLDEKGKVIDVEEKPKEPKSDLVIIGVYMFTPVIFGALQKISSSWRGEYELTEAIRILVKSPDHKVDAYEVDCWWDDTGTDADVLHANQMVLRKIKTEINGALAKDVKVLGPVNIGKGTVVKNQCVIRGPAIIGDNCKIGPKTYIGPYTSIGNNVKIVGGEIEYSIIMDGSTIEIDRRITDSLIGTESVIALNPGPPKGIKFVIGKNTRVLL